MNKLLIICGPTATGKTSLGFFLAKKYNGEIISADSRQVYQGMNIGTGKDLPKNAKKFPTYYKINDIKIYGYDLISPNQQFNVAHFTDFATKIIKLLWKKKKLPILVGGTGLYLNSLINPPQSLSVPINQSLRKKLSQLSVIKLQNILKAQSPIRFNKFNHSDKHNPRRLIRAIEVTTNPSRSSKTPPQNFNVLWIGLKTSLINLDARIKKRVLKRANSKFTAEVRKIKHIIKNDQFPASTATGYRPWLGFLEGKITESQALKKWQISETQYARRQLTWFKKNLHINWLDISKPNFKKQVVNLIKNWYPKTA